MAGPQAALAASITDPDPSETSVTGVLRRWRGGDEAALARLMPLVVEEMRRIARRYLSREGPGHTLQPTALVNEVYLRLAGSDAPGPEDRAQFFAWASRLMREVLVDHARARLAAKRGGGRAPLALEAAVQAAAPRGLGPEMLLTLDAALIRLAELDRRQSRVVELRYFSGLTLEEIAGVMAISRASAERDWAIARRFLARELGRGDRGPQPPSARR